MPSSRRVVVRISRHGGDGVVQLNRRSRASNLPRPEAEEQWGILGSLSASHPLIKELGHLATNNAECSVPQILFVYLPN